MEHTDTHTQFFIWYHHHVWVKLGLVRAQRGFPPLSESLELSLPFLLFPILLPLPHRLYGLMERVKIVALKQFEHPFHFLKNPLAPLCECIRAGWEDGGDFSRLVSHCNSFASLKERKRRPNPHWLMMIITREPTTTTTLILPHDDDDDAHFNPLSFFPRIAPIYRMGN